jgi:hypothetical protein
VNKVFLTGRLTRDPEMRSLASGKNVTTFTVASNEYLSGGREKAEDDGRNRNARHGCVLERSACGQPEIELADYFRNDGADGIGCHREHRKHCEDECLQQDRATRGPWVGSAGAAIRQGGSRRNRP